MRGRAMLLSLVLSAAATVTAVAADETSGEQHASHRNPAGHDGDGARQAEVAQRGAAVMPFDLERTAHAFEPLSTGGVQTVTSRDGDAEQIALIRSHLQKEAAAFQRGDFADPARIHGQHMPGLAELTAGAKRLRIVFEPVENGGRLRFSTPDRALTSALHRWFAAQASDHGRDAAGAAAARSGEAVPLTPAAASAIFSDFDRLCRIEGGRTWGTSLCGPLLLVAPSTRAAIANRPDDGGVLRPSGSVFVGRLPDTVAVANTAVEWQGLRWTQVLWPVPADPVEQRVLLAHEAFHRIQPALGFAVREGANAHLDSADGRLWLQLELRALAAALAGASDWRKAAGDALLFRAERRRLAPSAAAGEDALELNEGVAEYTGVLVGGGAGAARLAIERLAGAPARPSFVRSFAYATGPAYGLLLDRSLPGWRDRVRRGETLGALLAEAVGGRHAAVVTRASAYGYAELRAAEARRAEEQARRTAELRARLVDGSTLVLPLRQMSIEFDPNRVFTLAGAGSVYSGLRVRDVWGTLSVAGEGLLAPDWTSVRLEGPARLVGQAVEGPGWSLKLAPGWRLASGQRAGEQTLVAPAPGS